MSLWLLLFGHTDRISATGLPTNHFFSSHADHPAQSASVRFPTVRERSIDPAEFRGSASEARSRLHTHTHSHTHTQAHINTRGASLNGGSARFSVWQSGDRPAVFFHTVSRLVPDCLWPPQNGPGPRRAVRILRPATQIHLAPAEGPLADRAASSCSQPRDRMSRSSEESHSVRGGGSDSDLKMASSSNTTPEGGPPPPLHQNRIRQVGVPPLQPRSSCIDRPSQPRNEPLLMLSACRRRGEQAKALPRLITSAQIVSGCCGRLCSN